MSAPIYTSPSSVQEFELLYILTNVCTVSLLNGEYLVESPSAPGLGLSSSPDMVVAVWPDTP